MWVVNSVPTRPDRKGEADRGIGRDYIKVENRDWQDSLVTG